MTQASSPTVDARRPGGVSFIGVLAYVGGIVDIIGGSMLLVLVTGAAIVQNPVPGGLLTAITIIIAGIIVVAVAGGLLRGSNLSRLIFTAVRVVSIATQIIALTSGGIALFAGVVSVLISAIVLSWLWTPRANAYFALERAPR
ncbi:hypothetical protein [Microcella sp.]|uniref:hypothetical protein n=1 Tax=Microcella sp. TaxID=1913979 RepID=UPI00256779D0|nr:hypothetical protein [Microcella sp.]MBX9471323.1 hypothetical protein [Microcella sp.]